MSETENTPTPEVPPTPVSTPEPTPAPEQGAPGKRCCAAKCLCKCQPRKAALAGAAALVVVLLLCLMGSGSIDSNDEFMDFYDDVVEELRDDKVPAWTELRQRRTDVENALLGLRGGEEQPALMAALMANSQPALDYLVMKKGFRLSDSLLDVAILMGNLDICRYLIDEQGLEPREKHLSNACEAGHVEICEYLKEEQGMDATKPELLHPLLRVSADAYQMQLGMTAMLTGQKGDVEELKKNHVKVAKFLVKSGVNVKDDSVRNRISQCVNAELKKYLLDVLND